MDFENMSPKLVWRHFKNILSIPHPSLHEAAVREYAKSVAEECGAVAIEDEAGNLIIRKRACEGMEDRKCVTLQAHLDMVPQSDPEVNFDFERDSIEAYIDGDWLRAKSTTLGADNGLGVAAALAVLGDDKAQYGDIEILLTVNEERGMDGAFGLQSGSLQGEIMLNLDTEVEGELCIGCAGGLSLKATFENELIDSPTEGYVARRLCVDGLSGGHSGIQINLQRANANKLLFRFLRLSKLDIMLCDICGGTLNNAIPRTAYADILIKEEELSTLEEQIVRFEEVVRREFEAVESGITVTLSEITYPKSCIEESSAGCIVWAMAAAHDGVYRYSYHIDGLVETSANLAVVRCEGSQTTVEYLLRSFSEDGKVEMADTIASTFELADAEVICTGGYQGWQPNFRSEILEVVKRTYAELYGSEPEVKAVHAGLECGVIGASHPQLDMISFGPSIVSPHSPSEAVNIPSVERFYDLLLAVLRNIPNRV